jgi:hypothetical protein
MAAVVHLLSDEQVAPQIWLYLHDVINCQIMSVSCEIDATPCENLLLDFELLHV